MQGSKSAEVQFLFHWQLIEALLYNVPLADLNLA